MKNDFIKNKNNVVKKPKNISIYCSNILSPTYTFSILTACEMQGILSPCPLETVESSVKSAS